VNLLSTTICEFHTPNFDTALRNHASAAVRVLFWGGCSTIPLHSSNNEGLIFPVWRWFSLCPSKSRSSIEKKAGKKSGNSWTERAPPGIQKRSEQNSRSSREDLNTREVVRGIESCDDPNEIVQVCKIGRLQYGNHGPVQRPSQPFSPASRIN